jgi:hypothetical protein
MRLPNLACLRGRIECFFSLEQPPERWCHQEGGRNSGEGGKILAEKLMVAAEAREKRNRKEAEDMKVEKVVFLFESDFFVIILFIRTVPLSNCL